MTQDQTQHEPTDTVLALARELIQKPSITPEDCGCLEIIGARLAPLGFQLERMPFGEVDNLWATWGNRGPLCVLAGHTDVVPTGPLSEWHHPPFAAVVDDTYLHGRGSADMKVSLAAMVVACERLLGPNARSPLDPEQGQIAFLITSDEEGPAQHGTKAVVAELQARDITPTYCIVGEPSSHQQLGDTVRNGRRGSLNGELTVSGVQGHVAYPELAVNPITATLTALGDLANKVWDTGNDYYPPTSFQVSNIESGTGATNVVPGSLRALFNFRYCTEQTAQSLETQVEEWLAAHFAELRTNLGLSQEQLSYRVDWQLSGEPFLTEIGTLTHAVSQAIKQVNGVEVQLSTSGGTSDGRFIGPTGCDVVELGPINATIHKIDEKVALSELEPLAQMYELTLRQLLPS